MPLNHSNINKSLFIKLFLVFILVISFYFLPERNNYEYTQFVFSSQKETQLLNHLIGSWANFDGIHYLNIAGRGYIDEGRFLPLYPILISIFSFKAPTFSILQLISAQLISLISLIVFFKYLEKIIKLDFATKTKNTVYTILFFPTSFFLLSIYAESLFLALATMSFYFARKKYWARAILFASLSTITRLTGVAILIAIFWEFLISKKIINLKKAFNNIKIFLYFAFATLPLSIYSYFNYLKWDDPLYFINAHGKLANSRSTSTLINPLQTVFRYLKIIFTFEFNIFEYWIAIFELGIFFLAIILIYKLWQEKIRSSYLLYSTLSLLLPILSGTFTGLPRYVLTIFPIFIIFSQISSQKIKNFYYIASGLLLIILFMLFSRGYFIA